tara:strand:+ start:49415 stop:50020 length:606 start_codon:yes stop_codon:yes gene_type:complete
MLFGAAALPFLQIYPRYAAAEVALPLRRLVRAAEGQIGVTVFYDSAYRSIGYPQGDVPRDRGVCSDVVIRAYRDGLGVDLQRLVHEDMVANFAAYPRNWGLSRTDRNIDHRRVPNLMVFLTRQGGKLPKGTPYDTGDVVTQMVGGRLPHVVIVSDEKVAGTKRRKVIHNIGGGTVFADVLETYPVTGHYRWTGSEIQAIPS